MESIAAETRIPAREQARFLGGYLRPRLPDVAMLGVTLFTSIGLKIVNLQILRSFVDRATAARALRPLIVMALCYIGVAVAQQLKNVVNVFIKENLGGGHPERAPARPCPALPRA